MLQSVSGHFLPHDAQAIGMDAAALAAKGGERLVGFMFHDRVAFGGSILSVGVGYWWLANFPLRERHAWAWWTLLLSGVTGFGSFLYWLGYGYLDTWHGVATLCLLPVYASGMWRAARELPSLSASQIWNRAPAPDHAAVRLARGFLMFIAAGIFAAGATISTVGMTSVFVPQDLAFIGLSPHQLHQVSPTLIPLIAHDRAGFGGGLVSIGVLLFLMARHAPPTRAFAETVTIMGASGFGAAVGVHFAVGYTDFVHLAPAYLGTLSFAIAAILWWRGALVTSPSPR